MNSFDSFSWQVYEAVPCYTECNQYSWVVEPWSPCKINSEQNSLHCGEGIQTRKVRCVSTAEDDGGETVSNALCNQAEIPDRTQKCSLYCPRECAVSDWGQWSECPQLRLEKPVQTSSRCMVGCTVDCRLSAWSAWSQCSHTCGAGGQMVRGRSVVLRAAGEGRPCPEQLTQHRSCPVKPCYSWLLGPWSPCKIQGGQCGDGLQFRNLTCVVHDASVSATSKPVENALCGQLPLKESVLQLPCSVPCPGDCHLTEWSEWSSCELTCINGRSFETTGRQSRSRAFIVQSPENQESCSGQAMETRPCSGGKCYDYLWKTSLWRDNIRTVWCQRSDGINVTDGKLKMWVYGVSAGGFLLIVFLIFTSYLMCKKTKQHQSTPPQQKPLTLAYDGDVDM
ncbi:thrombospondin type-1 domain-containing protein 7B [Grus japonensis]|uniref:Thrombospondin type-1 domain-containing protein 7B n=1 Tax=Grus japonensis TaxID=30415 RepID=A0ABC9X0W7_GRUJA